jgi:mono/diheme cytochrome c family protein
MKRTLTLSWSSAVPVAHFVCMSLLITSCGPQLENFVSADETRYGIATGGTAEYQAAVVVLNNNCVACHSDFGSLSEAEWVATGKVVPGDLVSSTLYQSIRGSGVGAQNMPPSSTIGPSELEAIAVWIENASP